jgi:uncharacterized protein (DUF1015 family)
LRPVPEKAEKVSCAPYDVVREQEVRRSISGNPLSFLRITRSEADFAAGAVPSVSEVFHRSRENLQQFIREGIFIYEPEPSLYVYRLIADTHSQTGVVACCSLDEYEAGRIKKHEKTRTDKVRDRTDHLLTVRAQTGLIFLTFVGTDEIRSLIHAATNEAPIYDFYCDDKVRHTVWKAEESGTLVTAFRNVPSLYIADGHHRLESADLARKYLRSDNPEHSGDEEYNFVLAGIFPAEDLRILAYNRVVADLNGLTVEEFLAKLSENFIISDADSCEPQSHGEICMYLDGRWRKLVFAVNYIREPDPIERLDVSILENFVLRPVLGIEDERTDDRISFVGGKHGRPELERLVDEGAARVAFSLYPTTMGDLLAVSDAGEIMPPKSTWFEPKLKDGILIHLI